MALSNNKQKRHDPPAGKGRIFVRFRRINILLFTVAFCIMAAVMAVLFNSVITDTSVEYADRYAVSTAEALGAHMTKEIELMSKAAQSGAVAAWMADERNADKMALAYEELAGIVGELYSYNLYVVLGSSKNEYKVDAASESFTFAAILDEYDRDDSWYFDCIDSDRVYMLSVNRDHIMKRKRVWLDYKVVQNGLPLGVICTGLEFSHVIGELFRHYDSSNMRGLIIDRNGVIHMDSSLMDDKEFLHNNFEAPVEAAISNPGFLSAIESYLGGGARYFEGTGELTIVNSSSGPYRHMTISPIRNTDWSVIILSGSVPFFNISRFFPITASILILLAVFAGMASAFNYRLIFLPLNKLDRSLASLRESLDGEIYGAERDDEIGHLSQTIQDLFYKANVDGLTGIYNRRFMENNLEHIMELLSRSNSCLSVLMLDIDFFKKYNDTYGHEQGDVCLREVAKALADCAVRAGDFVARYGGEEFLVALPNTDESGARVVAEKLLDNVRSLNIPHKNSAAAPYVTVSIGAAAGKVSFGQCWDEYVKRADEALYASKENGRNKYTFLEYS